MFRFTLAGILIGIGVFSPWIVRDWLDWKEDERVANQLYESVRSIPGEMKESVRKRWEKNVPERPAAEQQSYPVATTTMRVLRGFLPDSLSLTSGEKIPIREMTASPPSTTRSRTVIAETSGSLRSELQRIGLTLGDPVFIRVFKEENELEVWMKKSREPDYTLFKVYRIADRAGKLGPKLREGDNQAPEGFYHVSSSRLKPETRHFLGIDLGFPNEFDRYHSRTGSAVMIHGGTHASGAFALDRGDMAEVYTLAEAAISSGQKFFRVNVFPFRMTDKRMAQEWGKQPRWIDFWANLKEGYDFFENVNYPPDVSTRAGRYHFELH